LGACTNNQDKTGVDSTGVTEANVDTIGADTSAVKQADSTRSFRNDRGTDSVSAGKTVPSTP
jgi:hypothetical protein